MGIFSEAIDNPMNAKINCELSAEDAARHLLVREWSNEKLMNRIHEILSRGERTRYIHKLDQD